MHGMLKDHSPVWSPDGRRLVFTVLRFARPLALSVMDVDGTDRRRLTLGSSADWR